jgi:hypothetical protein
VGAGVVTTYANDPRVRRANNAQFDVHADDKYLVTDEGPKGWWIDLAADSNAMKEAVLMAPETA